MDPVRRSSGGPGRTTRPVRSGGPRTAVVLAAVELTAVELTAVVLAAVVLAAVVPVGVVPAPAAAAQQPASMPSPAAAGAEPGLVPGAVLNPDRLPPCAGAVASLSPRDRLAQRLMVGVDAADPDAAVRTVADARLGGIFLGGDPTALLTEQRLREVQAVSRIPVAVAVDDEGGRVQRLDALDGDLPSAREAAASMTPQQVRAMGAQRGRALAARGVTVNLAPTVDTGAQPAGAVIGDRAYGADPEVVAEYAGAFGAGLRAGGVGIALKHFPGHGRADGDSHAGRVATPSLDELRTQDLRPYAALLGTPAAPGPLRGADTAVMVGHLDVPGLTGELPSSLTPAVYDLLRGELAFDGLVLTDDLGAMKAVTGTFEIDEAVLRALDAGADVALWSSGPAGGIAPERISGVLDGLETALAEGRLDEAESDPAVARVLAAKGLCS